MRTLLITLAMGLLFIGLLLFRAETMVPASEQYRRVGLATPGQTEFRRPTLPPVHPVQSRIRTSQLPI